MAEGFKFTKRLTPEADDLVIRTTVRAENGASWHPLTFRRERIDYVTGVSEGISGIVLKNGTKIPVAMPYEELEQKIYFADVAGAPLLDLSPVTGAALEKTRVPGLSRDFGAAAGREGFGDKSLLIAVFARQSHQQTFQMVVFGEEDIAWGLVSGGENGVNGPYTTLQLVAGKGPFGDGEILLDIPRTLFMDLYNKAKMEGARELDLRDLTRSGSPAKPKRGPANG